MNAGDIAPPPAITCSLDVEHRSSSVVLHGKFQSATDTEGDYSLQILKVSRSGSSTIQQSGTFNARAKEPLLLGAADVDAGPETRIVAKFTVRAKGAPGCSSEKEISDE